MASSGKMFPWFRMVGNVRFLSEVFLEPTSDNNSKWRCKLCGLEVAVNIGANGHLTGHTNHMKHFNGKCAGIENKTDKIHTALVENLFKRQREIPTGSGKSNTVGDVPVTVEVFEIEGKAVEKRNKCCYQSWYSVRQMYPS